MADITSGTELHSKTLTSATYEGRSVEIAKDFLQGYTEDYYFFQYDIDTYVLLYDFQDSYTISPAGISVSGGCSVFEIDMAYGAQIPETYNITGALVGDDTQVLTNVQATKNENSRVYQTYSVYYSGDISVSRNGKLCYSSVGDYPKLIEGVQNYAFTAFMLAVGVISFKLFDRLFRRIY